MEKDNNTEQPELLSKHVNHRLRFVETVLVSKIYHTFSYQGKLITDGLIDEIEMECSDTKPLQLICITCDVSVCDIEEEVL